MTAPVLEATGIGRDYRTSSGIVTAVAGVDISLRPEEMVAIVGPSGSGKTTLLQLLGLLLRPDRGELRIAGHVVSRTNDDQRAVFRRRQLGFVFQSFNLLPQLDALENVRIARPKDGEATVRARGLLDSLGLAHRLHHRPAQLSAGEQQRVAIARAWMNEPAILLADEPTGNLDEERQDEFLDLLRVATGRGQAVLLVTHNPVVAGRADRVLTMRSGRLDAGVADHLMAAGADPLTPTAAETLPA